MLPTTCSVVGAATDRAGEEPLRGRQNTEQQAGVRGERRQGLGVQEWSDGSRYEGEFDNGFKHGSGRYTWTTGEYYEGSFYNNYRHGDGLYCWPTGHKFIGKFYRNRKEGYGQHLYPDGATFQGLYCSDQRFGPGVVSYPDGRQDVGLWLGERLLRLCTSVEEAFSLSNLPEYASYIDPAATAQQPSLLSSDLQTESRAGFQVDTDRDLLSDETFILPPGIESYSTDGDHLPLPPGQRRELDKHFFGVLWEPDAYQHQGYKRDPPSTLPLLARMQAHIHRHSILAEKVDWDVAAILSRSREGFGPKGHLEVSSELLIQHASRGELQAVSHVFQTGLVHLDVADSQGHTALIAATVNCHNDVINLLLDMGADIDKLNCEGMSALAVCHVLYYPFHSLHTGLVEPSTKTQVLDSPSACGSIRQVDVTMSTTGPNNRPQTTNTTLSNQTNHSHLSDQTEEELTKDISNHSSKVSNNSEIFSERWPDLNEPETLRDTEQEEEEKEVDTIERQRQDKIQEKKENNQMEDEEAEDKKAGEHRDHPWPNRENEVKSQERVCESRNEDVDLRVEKEKDVEEKVKNSNEEDVEETEGTEDVHVVERSIQVLDGHIPLGSVQWKERRAKAQGKELTQNQNFDSDCTIRSFKIQVTEEAMQHSAEALSRTGVPQRSDTQETVRKMAAIKIEHRIRLKTLKLLLERGADPNLSKVPMPVLFLAVMAADIEAVRQLLLCGACTDIPLPSERKGLYPLHVAASLPGPAGPKITELLLHAITDPDMQACDQDEIYELDKGTNESPNLEGGGRTALHIACQRDNDYQNASKVVALLLSHRANTNLLWSGHSPLSLAIASGNDLAVEELLNGGADPNIPLGYSVQSALCALANINYLGGNRTKLLDMLAKAGADILMPVAVGEAVGTAVDYAHFSFNQDLRIADTPFHALNRREREIFKARHQLLSMMGDLLRQTAGRRETEYLESDQQLSLKATSSNVSLLSCKSHITENHRKPVLKFCYHCGRSVSVNLTACSHCHKVFYCSRICSQKSWDQRHKEECIQVSASAHGVQRSVVFKSQLGSRPIAVTLNSKTVPGSLSAKLKSQRVPKSLTMAEKVTEGQLNLKENYSLN